MGRLGGAMAWVLEFLGRITDNTSKQFRENQSVLSFDEYVDEVSKKPELHLRNCAQYFVDMIDSFGSYVVETPAKRHIRYRVFDADYCENAGKIFGQEAIQHELVSHLRNFVNTGRVDKLLMLHGPNGSAKTSIVQALAKASEVYSATDQGVIYQFSWIFPKKEQGATTLGFSKVDRGKLESYARLANDAVDAKLSSGQRDHPLLLLSPAQRNELFRSIKSSESKFGDLNICENLRFGDLSHKNRQIFDALLLAYHGDLAQVFRHVRVERFYFSRRYKHGLSVVEPQLSVDADLRQITSDQSVLSLPAALRHVSLFEAMGPLVDANRGIIEYSDLLKRPLDAWKYLLVACEQSQVSVGPLALFFDLLMVATSNELHLHSFREYPDWQSFKARIELIKVPYLLRSVDEQGIYLNQLPKLLSNRHVAPHAIEMAARWATLTRLEPPLISKYPEHLQEVIHDLTPEEKLELYNFAEPPARLSQKQAQELKKHIPDLYNEYANEPAYEGRFGASPREIRMLILNAAQDQRFDHLSAGAIFEQIKSLIDQKSSFEFLRRDPVRGYRDASFLLNSVKRHYVEILEDEVRNALGIYSRESYEDLFTRYILHVSSWIKKEQLFDPALQKLINPDEQFMGNIEQNLKANNELKDDYRKQLISNIGAFKLENPQSPLEYKVLFSTQLKRLKQSVYKEQREVTHKAIRNFIRFLSDGPSGNEKDVQALAMKEGLYKLGYNEQSARWAMAFLMQADTLEKEEINYHLPGMG